MAGLYVIFGDPSPRRLDRVAARMRFGGEVEHREHGEVSYVWLSHDNGAMYGPVRDPETGVECVVAGRVAWPSNRLREAERLPYEGGTANRLVLERYLTEGPAHVAPYSGAATVLVWDPRGRIVHVWTDQFGYHPAFVYGPAGSSPAVFTTFPDTIVVDPGVDAKPDLVSMAEFLRAWRITPPHTYYADLQFAGAATHLQWRLGKPALRREYWRPFEAGTFATRAEASDALAEAVKASVRERTAVAERPVFFVSGGADSRVMLFGASDPQRVAGINLYEKPTHESATAKQLCERVGARYIGFGRDNDFYPRMQADNVRWSGAMWSVEDNHYLGAHALVTSIGADLVMTACTTDWLFKGYGLERTYRRLVGRNLPLRRFLGRRVEGFLPNYPLPAPLEYADAIRQRMDDWFRGTPSTLRADSDYLSVEDRRVRPACYTVSVSGQIMYRTYPYDTFLADPRIADCYSRIPARWKLNGEVWGLAAGKVCAGAEDIVDANYGWRVDASLSSRMIAFGRGWIERRLGHRGPTTETEDHPPCHASWPDMGWYAVHSRRLGAFWASTPEEHRTLMTRLWGRDPWSIGLAEWSRAPNDLMRILTLLEHWRGNGGVIR